MLTTLPYTRTAGVMLTTRPYARMAEWSTLQFSTEKERKRKVVLVEENAQAGPLRRQIRVEAMQTLYLRPRGLDVQDVEADRNCLYPAVGVQCARLSIGVADSFNSEKSYDKIRGICTNMLIGSNRAEYKPFAERGKGENAQ